MLKLKEICSIKGGNSKLTKRYLSEHPGIYPVYGAAKDNMPVGCYQNYDHYFQEIIFFTTNTAKKTGW